MGNKEMKEALDSLHYIDYDDEVDDFYEEHLDKIKKLKKERDEHMENDESIGVLKDLFDSKKLKETPIMKYIKNLPNNYNSKDIENMLKDILKDKEK